MNHLRRSFLRSGATLGSILTIPLLSGRSVGEEAGEWQEEWPSLTYSFNRAEVERYQPLLVASRDARRKMRAMYGMKVQSDSNDLDCYVYWMQYTHQDGSAETLEWLGDLLARDTHLWDHEPSYIYVDPDTNEVDRIVCTGYHHFALELDPDDENVLMSEDRVPGVETHVNLDVVSPWHHYRTADREGTYAELVSWLEKRDAWKDNGFYDRTATEAIENPYSMLDRDSWWDESTWDYRFGKLWIQLGLGGARETDELRIL
ncbi:hypothetical protein [Natronocalculus amylovorans]|uniref:Uncharacterized protein n=1 Tax=Natronocalculus amylovorans TaxID=2917812 RepID=A0AAE3K9Q2_9EURY|nr:hypothetical protein [Natronocalculus amylovorans]MCL9818321.1 hypothetical protein [Natronocalculus amylovorans]